MLGADSPFLTRKGRPEKERAYRKYGIRQARLDLIQRWCKRSSRHYKLTKPHKNKRMKRVIILCNNQLVECTYFELKSMPVKPGSLYHGGPADIPRGQGYCVVCGTKTRLQCWGWLLELKDVFPVCPTSVRDCFQNMYAMRNDIWISAWVNQSFGSKAENEIWCFIQAVSENLGIFYKSTNVYFWIMKEFNILYEGNYKCNRNFHFIDNFLIFLQKMVVFWSFWKNAWFQKLFIPAEWIMLHNLYFLGTFYESNGSFKQYNYDPRAPIHEMRK